MLEPGEILVDDTHAVMDQAAFRTFQRYDLSIPTGIIWGKRWVRWHPQAEDAGEPPMLGEYYIDPRDEGRAIARIRWRTILFVDQPEVAHAGL